MREYQLAGFFLVVMSREPVIKTVHPPCTAFRRFMRRLLASLALSAVRGTNADLAVNRTAVGVLLAPAPHPTFRATNLQASKAPRSHCTVPRAGVARHLLMYAAPTASTRRGIFASPPSMV